MIRVRYIPTDDGREIAFFPDSRELFYVDEKAKRIIEDLSAGKERDYILQNYRISPTEFDEEFAPITQPFAFAPHPLANKGKVHNKLALHLANGCNLRCIYCYANGGVYHSSQDLMTREVLDRTVDVFYREYDHINNFMLFGGEPLLNMDMIDYACEKIQQIERSRGNRTTFGTVTNGTLINRRFVELVKKHNIDVTVSYDGDPVINDRTRVFPDGSPTSKIIFDKIQMLREVDGQPNGIQAAYTQYHADAGITPFDMARNLKEQFPGVALQIVPAVGGEGCPYVPKDLSGFPAAVAGFLNGLLENPDTIPPSFLAVEDTIDCLKDSKPYKRSKLCEACSGTLAVSTKGDIYPCYVLMDHKDIRLGSVFEDDVFHTDHYRETLRKFMQHNCKANQEECKDCCYDSICTHCMGQDEQLTGKLFGHASQICQMQRAMFDEGIKGLAKLYEKNNAE